MKIISGIFLFMALSTMLSAQFDPTWGYINEKQVDSLETAVKSELNDTLNMAAFRKLGFNYGETDNEKSIYFHQRQLELALKLKLKIWEADAYSQIADQYRMLGDIKNSHENFTKAIDIASDKKTERPNWRVRSFSNAKNEHEARITTLCMTYIMFGNLYRGINKPEEAKLNYNKALELGKSINNGKIISFYYLNSHRYIAKDSLLRHLQHSLEWAEKSRYYKQKGWIFQAIGGYYFRVNQMDSAKAYVHKSIESSQEQDLDPAFIRSNVFASNLYRIENKLDSAVFHSKEALMLAKRIPNTALVNVYENLANTFALVNTDSAYIYESLARKLNDSLSRIQLNRMTDYQQVLFEEELKSKEDENKLKLFALIAGLGIVLIVTSILYRNNRQKQNANKTLEATLSNLKSTQTQLIQSEKMASLGELTAGIAHEIQNPLNFVNNFSEVTTELIDEMNEEIEKGDLEEAKLIAADVKQNLEKINHHGKRADGIVKGMLQHSRKSSAEKEPTDINKLADEYLRLAYHGLRAKDQTFNAILKTDFDESIGMVDVIPQDLGRVILNLITNAFYAVKQKSSSAKASVEAYKPTVSVITKRADSPSGAGGENGQNGSIEITVKDNGNGIPKHALDKIFQPFFTTKPTGEGTGLGLSMSYDIVTKGHGGELSVETKEGQGSEFIISLPI